MKKYISLLSAAVIGITMVLPTVGCSSKKSSSGQEITETTSAAETAVTTTVPTTTTTTTTAPLMPPMSKPCELLDGFNENVEAGRLFRGYDNTVLFQGWADNSYVCYVFDPISNSVVRTLNINDNEQLVGSFSDGTIVTYSNTNDKDFHLYPKNSSTSSTIKIDTDIVPDYCIDSEHDYIYAPGERSGSIIRYDKDGNSTTLFKDANIVGVNYINPDNMSFCSNTFTENALNNVTPAIYSLEDGHQYAQLYEYSSEAFITKNNIISTVYDTSDQSTSTHLEFYDRSDGKMKKAYIVSDGSHSCNFNTTTESDQVLMYGWYNNENGGLYDISFIDTNNGTIASVKDSIDPDAHYLVSCYCRDLRRWIIAVSYYEGYNPKTKMYMIDPTMLKYEKKLEESTLVHKEYVPYISGEAFRDVRKKADEIEKKYGVTILVGDEVKNAEFGSGYEFTTTESSESPSSPEDEIYHLKALDYQLSLFPDGFFKHFQTPDGRFGLRIALVSNLSCDYYNYFTAGGVAYASAPWYNIAINSGMLYYDATSFYHELWHSTEQLITNKYGFDESEWAKLNPPGFDYSNDFDKYANSFDEAYNTLSSVEYNEIADYDAPYFASSYSLVTAMEDRATLFETLFSWKFDREKEYQFGTEGINKYPHLKAKLDYLAELSKKEFGYVIWEKVLKNAEGTYSQFTQ